MLSNASVFSQTVDRTHESRVQQRERNPEQEGLTRGNQCSL